MSSWVNRNTHMYIWMFGIGYTVYVFWCWEWFKWGPIYTYKKKKKVGVQDLIGTDLRKTVFIKLIIFCLMMWERLLYWQFDIIRFKRFIVLGQKQGLLLLVPGFMSKLRWMVTWRITYLTLQDLKTYIF